MKIGGIEINENISIVKVYTCECGKKMKQDAESIERHKKYCKGKPKSCEYCKGDGYISEHYPGCLNTEESCSQLGCPIKVKCENCQELDDK